MVRTVGVAITLASLLSTASPSKLLLPSPSFRRTAHRQAATEQIKNILKENQVVRRMRSHTLAASRFKEPAAREHPTKPVTTGSNR